MLPGNTPTPPFLLVQMMIRKGASKSRMVVKMAGGAQMLESLGGAGIEMGARNIEMPRKALAKAGLGITACDTGGNKGRSLWLEVGTGRVMVKIIGSKPTEL